MTDLNHSVDDRQASVYPLVLMCSCPCRGGTSFRSRPHIGWKIASRIGLILALIVGACHCHRTSNGRLEQTTGRFSIAVPEGWQVSQPVGIPFAILSAPPDEGHRPNLFTDGVLESATLVGGAQAQCTAYKSAYPDHIAWTSISFVTDHGLPGLKTRAFRRTREDLALALFHYAIQDNDRIIQITGSCAETTAERYEPLFDATIRSLAVHTN